MLILLAPVEWGELRQASGHLRLRFVALAFAAYLGNAALEAARLRQALASFGLNWGQLLRVHVVGVFFGDLLPGQLGSDAYKVAALRSAGSGLVRAGSLIVMVRVYGLLVLVGAAVLSSWINPGPLAEVFRIAVVWPGIAAGGWVLAAGFLVAVWLLWIFRGTRLGGRVLQHLRIAGSETRAALSTTSLRAGLWILALSTVILGMRVVILVLLLVAAGSSLSPTEALFAVSFTSLATLVPITFGGLGVREGVLAVILTGFGVSYEVSVLLALVWRLFIITVSLTGAAILMGGVGRAETGPGADHDA